MYDSILYGRPHAMQWLLLKSANFWVSSAEYYIGLLSLGQDHNVARLDTHALGSLQHAARLKTSWPGQWLHYLAAVVSICEYTVSNKGGLPCHCHDCGHIFCEGNYPPPPPPHHSTAYVPLWYCTFPGASRVGWYLTWTARGWWHHHQGLQSAPAAPERESSSYSLHRGKTTRHGVGRQVVPGSWLCSPPGFDPSLRTGRNTHCFLYKSWW